MNSFILLIIKSKLKDLAKKLGKDKDVKYKEIRDELFDDKFVKLIKDSGCGCVNQQADNIFRNSFKFERLNKKAEEAWEKFQKGLDPMSGEKEFFNNIVNTVIDQYKKLFKKVFDKNDDKKDHEEYDKAIQAISDKSEELYKICLGAYTDGRKGKTFTYHDYIPTRLLGGIPDYYVMNIKELNLQVDVKEMIKKCYDKGAEQFKKDQQNLTKKQQLSDALIFTKNNHSSKLLFNKQSQDLNQAVEEVANSLLEKGKEKAIEKSRGAKGDEEKDAIENVSDIEFLKRFMRDNPIKKEAKELLEEAIKSGIKDIEEIFMFVYNKNKDIFNDIVKYLDKE